MITKNINNIATALEDALEGVLPHYVLKRGRRSLNFALDFFQPHVLSLGLRVAKLSRAQVELVIPDKDRNLDLQGLMQEGVVVSAGVEAVKLLWGQNKPDGNFKQNLRGLELEVFKPMKGMLRLRMEMAELSRESAYASLATTQQAEQDLIAQIFDSQEQAVAQIKFSLKLSLMSALDWS
jgi:hypothetical protein